MKKFRELSLVYKITTIIVCILIIPTFLIGAFYYQSYKQSLYEEADKKLEESLLSVNRTIENVLADANGALEDIAYSQELLYFLDEKRFANVCQKKFLFQLFESEFRMYSVNQARQRNC